MTSLSRNRRGLPYTLTTQRPTLRPGTPPQQATKYIQNHMEIVEYMQNWKLKINPHKTQAITFNRKQTPAQITAQVSILGQKIPWTARIKYLGLTVDNRLTWAPAIILAIKEPS